MAPSSETPTAEQPHIFQLVALDLARPHAPLEGAGAALWSALDARALLRVDGEDAEAFLQGQLSQDMARVRAGGLLLAAHCTPKGRVTALFRCWHADQAFWLDCPAAIAEAAQRRLGLYRLRSRVRIEADAAAWLRTGVAGAAAPAALARLGIALPEASGTLARCAEHWCGRLAGSRWLLLSRPEQGAALRTALARELGAASAEGWALASLRDGEPEVLPETVEAFIPQMLNLDQLDGVSFRKGCYTGQEIVARTHYLGRVKRRMLAFAYTGAGVPAPGTLLTLAAARDAPPAVIAPGDKAAAPTGADEAPASAQLVWALRTHAGGGEALAVAQVPAESAGAPADDSRPAA